MAKTVKVEAVTAPVLISWRELTRVLAAGVVIGLVTLALYYLLDKYVFTPGLCSDLNAGTGRCENKLYFASGFAMVIGGIAGLFAMVQQRVFRPLLVVLLVSVGLWNILVISTGLPWLLHALLVAVIFAAAYTVFAWLVQLRSLIVSVVISVVLVVLMRLILTS
jgi:hypothetical protein